MSIRYQGQLTHRNDALASGDGAAPLKRLNAEVCAQECGCKIQGNEEHSELWEGVCDAGHSNCQLTTFV